MPGAVGPASTAALAGLDPALRRLLERHPATFNRDYRAEHGQRALAEDLFRAEADLLAPLGYRPVAQKWMSGLPGIGGLRPSTGLFWIANLVVGSVALADRPLLSVTYAGPGASTGPSVPRWIALVVGGVILTVAQAVLLTPFLENLAPGPLPLPAMAVIATAITGKLVGIRGAGNWVLAILLVSAATTLFGIVVGILLLDLMPS